jgi:deoxyinosine 3'endonuclease (endonuclease V)
VFQEHKEMIEKLSNTGDSFDLCAKDGHILGIALKNTKDTKVPIYVSVGHRVDLPNAKKTVLQCSKFRVPEPVRQADMRSRAFVREKFIDSK